MKAMIILADGVEECEALITYDLLFRAKIDVDLVGLHKDIISSHNVDIKAHKTIDEINSNDYDCLILPGGMPGTTNLESNNNVQQIIDEFVKENKYIAAICAAPSILIHKNLLHNNKFICFPGFENGLTPADTKAIKDDKYITAKGLGAAFEFSYIIISSLVSKEKADEVFSKIQY